MTTMVKNAANKEEKMAQLEEKRTKEIEEMTEDFNKRKREGLAEIKDKFNRLAQKVKIDANQIKEVLKCGKKVAKQVADLDNVEVLIPLS
jgi:predicted house-cleaning noncanonical NTP pyrophosphatase (MazG superfamily)